MAAGLDPRLPVLVGTGQISRRVDRGEAVLEPVELMADALHIAEAETGVTGVLDAAESIRVVNQFSWRYADPGMLVGGLIGASARETVYTAVGGNYVQALVNRTALDIQRGDLDLAVITGAEAWRSRTASRKGGAELNWTTQPDEVHPTVTIGDDEPLNHPGEISRGVFLPVQIYPQFEIALRAAQGLDPASHRRSIAELWSRFSDVAATNPNAWIQRSFTPEEIATATPDNRMIGFPYTKLMNSNNSVEQGAGLIMCSVAKAEALGIAPERWVFVHSGADAHDHLFVSNRADLCSSPAIRIAGRAALDLAGIGVDDVAHLDLYSCFPSAVQIAARELGIDLRRQLTVTGGMSFAGGPWNNYVMHGIATMVGVLREDPGSTGLCTANGGYTTKHAFGVYSTEPPRAGAFRHAEPQPEVDALPRRELVEEVDGPVTIESYTVMHDRDGAAERALVACLTSDGNRAWGSSVDAGVMAAMVTEEFVGRRAELHPDAVLRFD